MTDNLRARSSSGNRSRLYFSAALVALALVVVALLVIRSQGADEPGRAGRPASSSQSPSPSANSSPVATAESLARFEGSSNETTTAFAAASNWEIGWAAKPGSGFAVELLDKDGVSRGEVVTGKKKAKGSTFVSEEGNFKLKVTASGPWTIEIVGRASSK